MRFTRTKDKFECRIGGGCPAQDWIENLTGVKEYIWNEDMCKNCPFEKYINRLAEFEDEEDNRK